MKKLFIAVAVLAFFPGTGNLLSQATPDANASQVQTSPDTGNVNLPELNHVYKVGGGVSPPKLISSVDPHFSEDERRQKLTGKCIVQLVVGVDGIPRNVEVERSIEEDIPKKKQKYAAGLDATAVEAVKQYRFSPATFHDKAVPVVICVAVTFHIF